MPLILPPERFYTTKTHSVGCLRDFGATQHGRRAARANLAMYDGKLAYSHVAG
jgi:hypothetical protein